MGKAVARKIGWGHLPGRIDDHLIIEGGKGSNEKEQTMSHDTQPCRFVTWCACFAALVTRPFSHTAGQDSLTAIDCLQQTVRNENEWQLTNWLQNSLRAFHAFKNCETWRANANDLLRRKGLNVEASHVFPCMHKLYTSLICAHHHDYIQHECCSQRFALFVETLSSHLVFHTRALSQHMNLCHWITMASIIFSWRFPVAKLIGGRKESLKSIKK